MVGDRRNLGVPPAERGTGQASPEADEEARQREQGPEGDDPSRGLLTDEDDLSVRDRDLVEPGLGEAELGALELGDVDEESSAGLDESGTPGGDESHAAAEDLDEETDLVAGSEPAELPGATDDLFPQEEDPEPVRDGGEEGLPDDLADALDDHVRSGDVAWRQSGPSDESDALGGEFEFPAASGGVAAESLVVPIARLETAWPAAVLALCDHGLVALEDPATGRDGLPMEYLGPPGPPGALPPPLRFDGEPQRVTALAACGAAWLAATDRGMVFVARPGDPEWVVAGRYLGPDGSPRGWLPLGIARRPFDVIGSRVVPGRAWTWRAGGPLLRWDAAAQWVLEDEAPALRVLAEDAPLRQTLVFTADEEGAAVRRIGPVGSPALCALSGDATDVLLAPGACVAACGGAVWLGCRDPELCLLRGAIEAASWEPVPDVRAVRLLAALPGGAGVLAVRTNPASDADELVRVPATGGPPRLLLRTSDLAEPEPAGPVAGSRDRIDQLLVDRAGATAWIRSAGRVYAIALGGSHR